MFDCGTTYETRCHVSSSRISVPDRAQNCFGVSWPVSFLVSGRRRLPSPPAKIIPQRLNSRDRPEDLPCPPFFRQIADSIPETIRLIIDSTPALIHTALPGGHIDFFNQTWLRYVGLRLEK